MPVLAEMNLLENHDISFRRNEVLVYDAEGQVRSVPLRRSPSSHRITASCFSHATAGDFSEDSSEQNFERIISIHVWSVSSSRCAALSARKSCTYQHKPNVVYSCLDTFRK